MLLSGVPNARTSVLCLYTGQFRLKFSAFSMPDKYGQELEKYLIHATLMWS